MHVLKGVLLGVFALFILTCAPVEEIEEEVLEPEVTKATAEIFPTEGNNVTGTVTFEKVESGVLISVHLENLSKGRHGFHIHEFGDCSAADATSAGGHYNPTNMPHGAPEDMKRHVGDLGNIIADLDGDYNYEWVDNVIALNGPHSIIGRAVVVHAGEDDLTSQPSGAAGPRIACGVIGVVEENQP